MLKSCHTSLQAYKQVLKWNNYRPVISQPCTFNDYLPRRYACSEKRKDWKSGEDTNSGLQNGKSTLRSALKSEEGKSLDFGNELSSSNSKELDSAIESEGLLVEKIVNDKDDEAVYTTTQHDTDTSTPIKHDSKSKVRTGLPARSNLRKTSTKSGAENGVRLAMVRQKLSVYSNINNLDVDEQERDRLRKEVRERFAPRSSNIPATLRGLTSLANERIEDGIARGLFKNLTRGQKLERDHMINSPFLDTTEYHLNKIIQKQDIVPPWIEKQQELRDTAGKFKSRLRNDWKRHVARQISSRGGTLSLQIAAAEEYADAEIVANDTLKSGHASKASAKPFRDETWLQNEQSYHQLAITNLNTITRDYNLLAPDLAKKPYFNLERELASCYADVAPQVAEEIRLRANASLVRAREEDDNRQKKNRVLEKFIGDGKSGRVVHEENKPKYGFKEFWRDLFNKD